MALRKASASARSRSALQAPAHVLAKQHQHRNQRDRHRGDQGGEHIREQVGRERHLSMRSTSVLPGRSSSCWAVKTRLPRRTEPWSASRVPSASVNDTSWLRV
jgi:hypothetical protein